MIDILLVFIALKLVGAITWSWGAVLIPLWFWLAEVATGVVLCLFFDFDFE
jgi:hypothetical protein